MRTPRRAPGARPLLRRAVLLVVPLLTLLGVGPGRPTAGAEDAPPAFDGSRAALELPDALWEELLTRAGRPDGRLGYTPDELRAFRSDTHLLRNVQALFADVRRIPRETGRITDGLLENAAKLSEVVMRGYALADVSAGRMYEPPKDLRWGLDDLQAATTPAEALRLLADGAVEGDLDAVPVAAQRLLAKTWAALRAVEPWLRLASPPGSLFEQGPGALVTEDADAGPLSQAQQAWAVAPWKDEWRGQTATRVPDTLRWVGAWRREALAYASAVLAVHVERALDEYRDAPEAERTARALAAPVRLGARGARGGAPVLVFGPGADVAEVPAGTLLTLDLGGDDRWSGHLGASLLPEGAPTGQASVHIDLGGDDTYTTDDAAALATGLFGIGLLIDLAGDDAYRAPASNLGCGLYGTGVLYDAAGDDTYRSTGPFGQGSGHVGVGALVDLAGDDDYECNEQAQGLGGTLGAGLLIDLRGNDAYVARDDGAISELYKGQSVAMAQGCGFGRRADLGDGQSLAGGVGVLVDGAGDDRYHAQVWAQGCGYWWSLGILEDRGGDDQYQNGKYSAGAAAHFAIGVCVDLAGDDVHNGNNPTAVNQWQGHARDGSIGVFIDGDGDDGYDVNNHCAGSADLNSIGLFWDRRGDDRYTFHDKALGPANGWTDTGAFGTVTRYTPFRSFRDDLPSWGLFLDTGGRDTYAVETAPSTFPATPARDDADWSTGPTGSTRFVGLGLDRALFKR